MRAQVWFLAMVLTHPCWQQSHGADVMPEMELDVNEDGMTLGNGIIELRLRKDGVLVGLSNVRGHDLLANGGRGYWNAYSTLATKTRGFIPLGGPGRVVRHAANLIEVAFRHAPSERVPRDAFPFDAHLHYILRRGQRDFCLFMTIAYRPGMPAGRLTQFAYTLRLDPQRFRTIAVDDERRHTSHSPKDEARAEKIMDATYRLADRRVVTKYDYCHDIEQDTYHVYGWSAAREGVWFVQPSAEYYPCTPVKRVLTSHQTATTPVIVWQPQCTHGGGVEIVCEPGESWRKLYGPLSICLNTGTNAAQVWADARYRHKSLAERWPYAWMNHDAFPIARGTVTGILRFPDGRPALNATVILSPPGIHWSAETRGYHFWARTDKTGHFVVRHVRAGTYILTAMGADQFQEFSHGPIAVRAGETVNLGALTWKPVAHGRRIWQVGVADRTTGEFRNGDDYRHWGLWRRYPKQFPKGVSFTIGKSNERMDWNFAHWSWHSGSPAWTIAFDLADPPRGEAILTFGIAAALPHDARRGVHTHRGVTDVRVSANGHEVGRLALPSTGGVGYRSARHSTQYNVVTLRFSAARLKAGRNVIALRHAHSDEYRAGDPKGERGAGPGYVMYDAVRLELAEGSARRNP